MREADVLALQRATRDVVASPAILETAARIVLGTQPERPSSPERVRRFARYGAGPRGAQALVLAAKARALLAGRFNATMADVESVLRAGPPPPHRPQLRGAERGHPRRGPDRRLRRGRPGGPRLRRGDRREGRRGERGQGAAGALLKRATPAIMRSPRACRSARRDGSRASPPASSGAPRRAAASNSRTIASTCPATTCGSSTGRSTSARASSSSSSAPRRRSSRSSP